jgi:hypothetical protein
VDASQRLNGVWTPGPGTVGSDVGLFPAGEPVLVDRRIISPRPAFQECKARRSAETHQGFVEYSFVG